jgi:hypothetical protein
MADAKEVIPVVRANATNVILKAFEYVPFGLDRIMVKSTWGWTEGTKFPKLENVSDVFTLGKDLGVTAALTKDYSTITGKFPLEEHVYLYVSIKEVVREGEPGVELNVDFISFDKCDMPFDERFKALTDFSAKKGVNRCGILCFVTGKKSPISVDVPVFSRKDFKDEGTFINDMRSKSVILTLVESDKFQLKRHDIPCE